MRVFIYKRTHLDDPNEEGLFGILDCMGRMRAACFDAVIGIGGISANPVREGISGKITWIGIEPKIIGSSEQGNPILGFRRFYLRNEDGIPVKALAPKLAKRMYNGAGTRFLMLDDDPEVESILALARKSKPSSALVKSATNPGVRRTRPKQKKC